MSRIWCAESGAVDAQGIAGSRGTQTVTDYLPVDCFTLVADRTVSTSVACVVYRPAIPCFQFWCVSCCQYFDGSPVLSG